MPSDESRPQAGRIREGVVQVRRNGSNGGWQFREMADDAVRFVCCNRLLAVAEVDRYDRHTRRLRGADVGRGIADHDRALGGAAGRANRPPQHFRVRLLDAECVLSADRFKAAAQSERVE